MNISLKLSEVYLENAKALRKVALEILKEEPDQQELVSEILKQAEETLVKADKCADMAKLEVLRDMLLK